MNKQQETKGRVIVYKNKVEVCLEAETVWLSQAEIAKLFGTKRPAITKHLSNIFKAKELDKKSVCSILEHTASDGKKYEIKHFRGADKSGNQKPTNITASGMADCG